MRRYIDSLQSRHITNRSGQKALPSLLNCNIPLMLKFGGALAFLMNLAKGKKCDDLVKRDDSEKNKLNTSPVEFDSQFLSSGKEVDRYTGIEEDKSMESSSISVSVKLL